MPLVSSYTPDAASPLQKMEYVFDLYESNLNDTDLHPLTGVATPGIHNRVARLDAYDKSLALTLNRPGSGSFRVPLQSSDAMNIVGYEVVRCIVVSVSTTNGNFTPVWSGFIGPLTLDSSSQSVVVSIIGWMQMLYGRECDFAYFFDARSPGDIAMRLLGAANSKVADASTVVIAGKTVSAQDLTFGAGQMEDASKLKAGGTASGGVSVSQKFSKSGAASASIRITSSGGTLSRDSTVDAGGAFPVTGSTLYAMRGTYVTTTTGQQDTTMALRLNWYDSGGALLSQSTSTPTLLSSIADNTQLTFTATSPASAVTAIATVVLNKTGTSTTGVQVDDVVVAKTSIGARPLPISEGTTTNFGGPTLRTRTYQPGMKIGAAIEELSNIENGFDWEVALVGATVNGGNTLLRKMNVTYTLVKTATTINGIGTDRPDVVFGQKMDPNNLANIVENRDTSRLATRMTARASNAQTAMAQDITAINKYNLWEDSVQISDSGISDDSVLGYAGAELAFRKQPVKTWQPTPFPWSAGQGTPRFWLNYNVGDIVYLAAADGALQISRQPVRVFGVRISIDQNGNERLDALQTAAT